MGRTRTTLQEEIAWAIDEMAQAVSDREEEEYEWESQFSQAYWTQIGKLVASFPLFNGEMVVREAIPVSRYWGHYGPSGFVVGYNLAHHDDAEGEYFFPDKGKWMYASPSEREEMEHFNRVKAIWWARETVIRAHCDW